ncbi:MAG: peptidylprolyl isomerase [Kofleriaceae bacterium]
MARFACSLAATAFLVACPGPAPIPPKPIDDTPIRIRIATAEAKRGDGVGELVERATRGAANERVLALRGLGRSGGARARAHLARVLADGDPAIVAAAASAYGLLGSLDELSVDATTRATTALLAALERVPDGWKPMVIEAIGRVADTSVQSTLVELLQRPTLGASAALALGRFGRRKIELTPNARLALIDALGAPATAYGAAYAFARAQLSTDTSATTAAAHDRVGPPLAALIDSPDGSTRAVAIQAIVKQNVVGSAHAQLEKALLDGDWRVGVEAVRALAGDKGDDAGRDAVAAVVVRRYAELERGKATEAHVVIEALKVLAPHAKRPLVASALAAIARSASASTSVQGITYGWIECLSLAAMARSESADLALVENCKLPDHLRLPLVAELVGAKVGPLAQRRTMFAKLLAHTDVRVRAAALGHLASFWSEGSSADRDAIISTLVTAIGTPDPIYAGSAIDAAPAIYDAIGASGSPVLDAAIVARAHTEKDPELAASVLELVGKRKVASGVDACRGALEGHPVLATAARHCLLALGEPASKTVRDEPAGAFPPPGIDLSAAFGGPREWVLTTARGEIVIALDETFAPWAAATIVTLTNRGFYDNLEFHRVVPNFVVQGGDPTQSGWGGPGFTLPAEPSAAGFVAGGVGMADAGRDSAGSQWFVMHAPAPHLDARYTFVGRVTSGSNIADALLIGDRVERAVIRDSRSRSP